MVLSHGSTLWGRIDAKKAFSVLFKLCERKAGLELENFNFVTNLNSRKVLFRFVRQHVEDFTEGDFIDVEVDLDEDGSLYKAINSVNEGELLTVVKHYTQHGFLFQDEVHVSIENRLRKETFLLSQGGVVG